MDPSNKKDHIIKYNCQICGIMHRGYFKDPKTQLFWQTHSKRHTNKCAHCTKMFVEVSQLLTHMQIFHGFKEYKCEYCKFSTYQEDQMISHLESKHSDQMHCKKCRKRHKKGAVCRPEAGLCQYCGYKSKTLLRLGWHIRTYHTERTFECDLCNKKMATSVGLSLHMRHHENPRPRREHYRCDDCGKKFKDKSQLRNHMNTHTGLKPMQCSICQKNFAKRETLRQHLLTHTGKRPYECDLCDKTFVQKPAVTSHRSKCHPGNHPPMPKVYIDSYIKEVDPKMVHKPRVPVPKFKTHSETFDDFRAKLNT